MKKMIINWLNKKSQEAYDFKIDQFILGKHSTQTIIEGDRSYTVKREKRFLRKPIWVKVYNKEGK